MKSLRSVMKYLLAATFAFSLFLVMPSSEAHAGWWTWKKYRLKFWIPKVMHPTNNNKFGFIAKGHGIVLKISPWRSRRTTSKGAALYGYRTYNILHRKKIITSRRIRTRGAHSYLLVGRGYYRGTPAYFAVIGLAARRSANNFYVRMWWRKRNHFWMKSKIIRIAKSLYAY